MRVFKTTYKDRKGRTKEAAAWYVEFRDHLDTVRRLPAFPSKAASEEMGRNLEKLVAYHKASGGQTDPALTRFLAGLPAKTRERLVVLGLLAPERVAIGKRLADHLDDFGKALTGKGNTPFHVEVITKRAGASSRGAGSGSTPTYQPARCRNSCTSCGRTPRTSAASLPRHSTSTFRPSSNSVAGWYGTGGHPTCPWPILSP